MALARDLWVVAFVLAKQWQRNLAAAFVAQFLSMTAWSFFFPFIPLYLQTLGVRGDGDAALWAGAIAASAAISMALFQPIWGAQADRVGRKPMLVRALLGLGSTTLLMGFATSPEQLLLLRFIQGAVSGTGAASNALVASCTPREKLGFAMGLNQVASFVGASTGPAIGGVVADAFGYRASFYAAAVLMFAGAVLIATTVQEDFKRPAPGAARGGMWAEIRSLMAIAAVSMTIVVIFLIQFGATIVTPVLSLFIVQLHGGDNAATVAGLVMASTGAASAVSALTLGRMSDRVGPVRVLTVCLMGAALFYFPQAFVEQVWQLLLLQILVGLFLGGLMPTANVLLVKAVPPSHRGAAFGLTAAANALASAAAPLSGAGVAAFAGIRAVFVATGFLYAFGCGWVTLGLRRR